MYAAAAENSTVMARPSVTERAVTSGTLRSAAISGSYVSPGCRGR